MKGWERFDAYINGEGLMLIFMGVSFFTSVDFHVIMILA